MPPSNSPTGSTKTRSPLATDRLRLEHLEDRVTPAVFTVTTDLDVVNPADGVLSLREAIDAANASVGKADIVKFANSVSGTITLDSNLGQLAITDDLRIHGPGTNKLTVSGGNASRVFAVLPGPAGLPEVTFRKLTIADGKAADAPGYDPAGPFAFGGGIYNQGGTVDLVDVVMTGNLARGAVTAGGAVANEFGGTLTVADSRFDGNVSRGDGIAVGGAITSDLGALPDGSITPPPTVRITGSTFTNNVARSLGGHVNAPGFEFSGFALGGAVLNVTGTMTISGSHFAGNAARGGVGDGTMTGGPAFGGAVFSASLSPFGIGDAVLQVSGSTFTNNVARGGDGAAGVTGGEAGGGAIGVGAGGVEGFQLGTSAADLRGNEFAGNRARGGDGGDGANGGTGTGGGVVGIGGADLTLRGNTFTANRAVGGFGGAGGIGAPGLGGGLGLSAVDLAGFAAGVANGSSTGDTFTGNVAVGGIGGGIFNRGEMTLRNGTLAENQALGRADVTLTVVPGYVNTGSAVGGGAFNLGTITVRETTFTGNNATAVSGIVGEFLLLSGVPNYPGIAGGGGLYNGSFATGTVSGSAFVGNTARGGDNGVGTYAGAAGGGGIYNDGTLTVRSSDFRGNAALGGNNNTSDISGGLGFGGGISTGTVNAVNPFGPSSASLTALDSTFVGNVARGGIGNTAFPGLPVAQSPGSAFGGGIQVYQGTAAITGSTFRSNRAVGGDGIGVGGGVLFLDYLFDVRGRLTDSVFVGNVAAGGAGADGIGGGVAVGSLGSILSAPGSSTTISGTRFVGNLALGGAGVSGGDGQGGGLAVVLGGTAEVTGSTFLLNQAIGGAGVFGGDGQGGGVYNAAGGSTTVERSIIILNRAVGGNGVVDGQGEGGGAYNGGTAADFGIDPFTLFWLPLNLASDTANGIFGPFSIV